MCKVCSFFMKIVHMITSFLSEMNIFCFALQSDPLQYRNMNKCQASNAALLKLNWSVFHYWKLKHVRFELLEVVKNVGVRFCLEYHVVVSNSLEMITQSSS